ncbi:glycosyltransferase family A protein [Anaerorhabdus sp.]|uniref:glycosyltransferase family A protein n=1 Tax=Anaerorhabdus sp. TaxID=1872524 RepID=UPI002FC6726D
MNEFLIAISTMEKNEQEILQLYKTQNITSKALFVNQCDDCVFFSKMVLSEDIDLITSNKKGLSKSRNIVLEYANSDIILIGDDDVFYVNEVQKIVIEAYRNNPKFDVICFKTNLSSLLLKDKRKLVNWLNLTSICSPQISFKIKSIRDNNISFNTLFGAGSNCFSSGEENIFISNCLKKGLNVLYLPIQIIDGYNVENECESSWFKGYSKEYFESKGALMFELYKNMYLLMCFLMILANYRNFTENYRLLEIIRHMKAGKNKLLLIRRANLYHE